MTRGLIEIVFDSVVSPLYPALKAIVLIVSITVVIICLASENMTGAQKAAALACTGIFALVVLVVVPALLTMGWIVLLIIFIVIGLALSNGH